MSIRFPRFVLCVIGSVLMGSHLPAQAPQIAFPPPSPESTLRQVVGLTDLEVVYSRPGAKGRLIFGALVPFGEVWRTGANSATKITFGSAVKLGGQSVPAGSYALFTIPDRNEWTVILSKVTGEWGAYSYNPANDLVRVKARPAMLSQPVETFTIDFSDLRTESANLNLSWEKTRVTVPIQVDVVGPVVTQIDAAMKSGATLPAGAYFAAAMFYYDHGLDLNKARAWIEQATKDKPPFYMLHGKAKILAKLGDKAGATAAARQSIAAAEGPAKAEYARLNEALIANLK